MRKPTIYEALRRKLGREPTNAELKADVKRIIGEGNAMGMKRRRKRRMSANLGAVTKQDFVAIANILCGTSAKEGTIEAFGNYFASQNSRFDRSRFDRSRFERAARCDNPPPRSRTKSQWEY